MPQSKSPVSKAKVLKRPRVSAKEKTSENEVDELISIINRNQQIIDALENNPGWLGVVEDFEYERQRLDDNWQFIKEQEQWIEWRATKMAVLKILNVLNDYKNDIKTAQEKRYKLENPSKEILMDVDNS